MTLFEPCTRGGLALQNRIVMAPLTRSRAEGNVPNALMAEYYGQRGAAGLIVTEGTSPAPAGLGYARIPGLYNGEHVAGWRLVTSAVHRQGAKIFVQLMHTGRVGHVDNLPAGAAMVGPMDEQLPGEIWTDTRGMQPHSPTRAMTAADIEEAIGAFVTAARLALQAGFDGVELHAANGYLLEQFLNANANRRTDEYGGSAAKRNRLVLEVARRVVDAIGAERVGIRISPYGNAAGTGPYEGVEPQYLELARQLGELGLAYLHLVDHSSFGSPAAPPAFRDALRAAFPGLFIASGGLDRAAAEALVAAGKADLVAFGRPWIANPDLVERLQQQQPLNAPDPATFYTPGARGYTDYPRLAA